MKKYVLYFFCGIITLGLFGLLVYKISFSHKVEDYLHNYNKDFHGIISKNETGTGGNRLVSFDNGYTFIIISYYRSDMVKDEQLKLDDNWFRNSLNIFLQRGDSIFKPQSTDTIYLYRKGIEYIFINKFDR